MLARIWRDEKGSPLVEAALVVPVLLTLGLGVIEFGYFFYQYQLIASGVRDAARYLSRLDTPSAGEAAARALAVTGTIDGKGAARVPFLKDADVSFAYTTVANAIDAKTGLRPYRSAGDVLIVEVRAEPTYQGIGFLDFLGLGSIPLRIAHEERVIHE